VTIDADFFRGRLADELRAFTPTAISALVAAVVTGGGTEYAVLLGAGGDCDCPSHGDGGEEDDEGGDDAPTGPDCQHCSRRGGRDQRRPDG
jgi:hypothetical protein